LSRRRRSARWPWARRLSLGERERRRDLHGHPGHSSDSYTRQRWGRPQFLRRPCLGVIVLHCTLCDSRRLQSESRSPLNDVPVTPRPRLVYSDSVYRPESGVMFLCAARSACVDVHLCCAPWLCARPPRPRCPRISRRPSRSGPPWRTGLSSPSACARPLSGH
jgi:hypothetical protein